MKLIKEAKLEKKEIGEATCRRCENVYLLDMTDLYIGAKGIGGEEKITWHCPNCANVNVDTGVFEKHRTDLQRIATINKIKEDRAHPQYDDRF